jgi:hypothetical protein
MRRFFELSRHRRANVWLDEAPPAEFTATSSVTRIVKPNRVMEVTRTIAGIELKVPRGPGSSYALLGAELVEADRDGLEVVVGVNKAGFPFRGSLAPDPNEIRIGLLGEYADAVVVGVAKFAVSNAIPDKAALHFRWAAHGIVGSSPAIFEETSSLVLQVMTLQRNASDEDVRALFG